MVSESPSHADEMERAQADLNDAVASKNETEHSFQTLKSEIEATKDDASNKKRTAIAYIDSLKTQLAQSVEEKQSLQRSFEEQAKALAQADELVNASSEEITTLKQQSTAKDEEVQRVKEASEQKVLEARREAEAVRTTRIELDATVESKLEETEQHKRLRQLAKTETLSLAKKLEASAKLSETVHFAIESTLVPRVARVSSVLQNLEWKVDAALSAVSVRRGELDYSGSNRESRTTTGRSGESSDHVLEKAILSIESLKEEFDIIIGDLKRVLDKTVSLSEYALEETTVWHAASKSLKRAIGDCIAASTRGSGNTVAFEPLSRQGSEQQTTL